MKSAYFALSFLLLLALSATASGMHPFAVLEDLRSQFLAELCARICVPQNATRTELEAAFPTFFANVSMPTRFHNLTSVPLLEEFNAALHRLKLTMLSQEGHCVPKLILTLFKPNFVTSRHAASAVVKILSENTSAPPALPRIELFKNVAFNMPKDYAVKAIDEVVKREAGGKDKVDRLKRIQRDLMLNYPSTMRGTDLMRFFFFVRDEGLLFEFMSMTNASLGLNTVADFVSRVLADIGYKNMSAQVLNLPTVMGSGMVASIQLKEFGRMYIDCAYKHSAAAIKTEL